MRDPRPLRPVADVSRIPTVRFGSPTLAWWGTIGFVAIEGTTLVVAVIAYLYLRDNFPEWPPARTKPPELLWGTVTTLLMFASVVPMRIADKYAKELDRFRCRPWLVAATAFEAAILATRAMEFTVLNVRWDTNAYGSIVWAALGFHTFLLAMDFGESAGIAGGMYRRKLHARFMSDASDDAMYWYFTVASWAPFYVLLYLVPRWV